MLSVVGNYKKINPQAEVGLSALLSRNSIFPLNLDRVETVINKKPQPMLLSRGLGS